jgi:hypothetical protein
VTALELVVRAIEAVEDGRHDEALLLLSGLEDQLARPARTPRGGFACQCGQTFAWPGLLSAHRTATGHDEPEEAKRAA